MAISALSWIVIRIGSQLLLYFDQLLKWLFETQIPRGWARLTDRCEAEYFARLVAECREYQGRGFSGEGLDLENVFVPLGLNPELPAYNPQDPIPPEETAPEPTLASGQAGTARKVLTVPPADSKIGALLQRITPPKSTWRRLVILGAPGSGKTTLLRHITLLFALRKPSKLSRGLPPLVPVLLRLRDVTALIVKDTPVGEVPNTPLAEVIARSRAESDKVQSWFEQRLNAGKCLVMLDGLDEVADSEQRQQVSAWVYQQL
jgi:hypothetical protein